MYHWWVNHCRLALAVRIMAIDKHGLKILSEIVRLIHGLLSSVSYLDYEDL